jgi:hypothetical protein
MHIPDDPLYFEKFYFTPGDLGFVAVPTPFCSVGPLVCWDQWYPEAARLTALRGAEVLFYPTAIGWHPGEKARYGKHQLAAWQTMQRSHAIANGVFVLPSIASVGAAASGSGTLVRLRYPSAWCWRRPAPAKKRWWSSAISRVEECGAASCSPRDRRIDAPRRPFLAPARSKSHGARSPRQPLPRRARLSMRRGEPHAATWLAQPHNGPTGRKG